MNIIDAAAKGSVEDIIQICQTTEDKEELLNKRDENGETPLWKAIEANSMEAVVALVALGATVNISSNKNKTPIHLALKKKNMGMFKFLFCFGGYPIKFDMIVEWECRERFQERDQTIISTFAEYCRKQRKFAKGYIKSGVLYVASGSKCLENDIAEIENNENNVNSYFFLTCLRDTTDIEEFHDHLRKNQQPFSDIYEFRAHCSTKVSCSVKLKIPDVPAANEELSILCFVGNCYKLDSCILDKFTEYKVHIDLKNNEFIRFAIVKSVITENFTVTGSQKTFTLQTIRGASIDLPPEMVGAQVAVSATKTEEENQKGEHKIICSDVLHIDICGKGSANENIIYFPLHENSPTNQDDVCLLVSNISKPNQQSDWSIKKRGVFIIENGKVEFHSSIDIKCCVAVVEKFLNEAKTQVIRTIRGEHDIKMFAMLKHQQNEYSLIVEFALLKSFAERQSHWEKMDYNLESYVEKTVRKNKPYKISFSGEIEVRGWNENDSIITYLPNKDDRMFQEYHLLNCNTESKRLKPKCNVHIGGPVLTPTSETMIDKIKAMFKNDIKPLHFKELTYLPIGYQVEEPADQIVDGLFNTKTEGSHDPKTQIFTHNRKKKIKPKIPEEDIAYRNSFGLSKD